MAAAAGQARASRSRAEVQQLLCQRVSSAAPRHWGGPADWKKVYPRARRADNKKLGG